MFNTDIEIDKHVLVEKSAIHVYQTLSHFSLWTFWSSWLILEPDCKVTTSGAPGTIGHSQEWNGDRLGSGQMTLVGISNKTHLEFDLEFKKPYRSKAKVWFDLSSPSDVQTLVRWKMKSKLPWFLFFLKKSVLSQVSLDYERGLHLLKDFCELGNSGCQLEFPRSQLSKPYVHAVDAFTVLGIKTHGTVSGISQLFQSAYGELHGPQGFLKDLPFQEGICLCHTFDRPRDKVSLTIGHKVKSNSQQTLHNSLDLVKVESHHALIVTLKGPYKHLSTAWQAIKMLQKSLKYRPHPTIAPYEVYISDPLKTPARELTTQIYLPIQVPT